MKTIYPLLSKSIYRFKKYLNNEYIFLPVATEEEITNYEASYNIKLPKEYRWFLLNIANGILRRKDFGGNLVLKIEFDKKFSQYISDSYFIPFGLTTKTKFHSQEDDEEYYEDNYPYKITYDKNQNYEGCSHGYISLAGYGCGTYAFIVINGEEYGNIWIHDIPSNDEVYPEIDAKKNKKRLEFIDWICLRMDHHVQLHLHHVRRKQKLIRDKRREEKREKIRLFNHQLEQKRKANREQKRKILETLRKIVTWVLAILLAISFIQRILS
ncbi:MAG: SMI1/KNR4 family protein [Saprospiraceae bacterium]